MALKSFQQSSLPDQIWRSQRLKLGPLACKKEKRNKMHYYWPTLPLFLHNSTILGFASVILNIFTLNKVLINSTGLVSKLLLGWHTCNLFILFFGGKGMFIQQEDLNQNFKHFSVIFHYLSIYLSIYINNTTSVKTHQIYQKHYKSEVELK